jgi:hypothetical protein
MKIVKAPPDTILSGGAFYIYATPNWLAGITYRNNQSMKNQ